MTRDQLVRLRWAVRASLMLGVVVSVIANVLHALDNPISQAIAAWPPVALLLTVELISRVPVHRPLLAFARLIATTVIAGIAAWVSYWHMVGVAVRYGETDASPYLIPVSVDGMIVVASICLIELGGRIQQRDHAAPAASPVRIVERIQIPAPHLMLDPIVVPLPPSEKPRAETPSDDVPAGQRAREDSRTAQQVEAVVRAMRASFPDRSQREIAALACTSPSNVSRILAAKRNAGREPGAERQRERVPA
ncbi:DUF2637 domain-containing protein [Actinoplanes sp. NPDC048796]|uniref:DUF2637 domain-containing protein n=1 Tax=Actinoplanes sp. NPDC048796 TaxID=3155640 RepID=UPI0033E51276